MYNYIGDYMRLFDSRQKINSYVMKKLIYETSLNNAVGMYELLDKVGIVYDEEEVKINILVINVELSRYSLYKDNKSDVIDSIIDNVYNDLFYNLQLSEDVKIEYRNIISNIGMKIKTLFTSKKLPMPKDEYIYHLLLESIDVNEAIIERMYIREFYSYSQLWINNAEGINSTYKIEDTEIDKKKNETIDFRF